MADQKGRTSLPNQHTLRQNPVVTDGFNMNNAMDDPMDLGASTDAPPAYGDLMDKLNLSQAGFSAGAAVTDDGRVNININQTSRKLADLLAPTLRSQLLHTERPSSEPLPPAYIPPSLGGQPGQTPPPKLNVVIQIVGSRGDVQPFVALGKVLKDTYGHRVRLATHPTFRKFVEENGLEFFSIGGDPAELMAFMVKNPGLMPGMDTLRSGEITKRRRGIEEIILGCWRSCIEAGDGMGPPPEPHKNNAPLDPEAMILPGDPASKPFVADAIIANPPSFAHIHVAEKMGIPLHMVFTMPWSPTRAFPHPLANIQSSNTDVIMTNYVSYALVEMMTWQGLGDVINRFRSKTLDLEPLSMIWAPGILTRLHIPTTYCWSPALIPKPQDWGREISIPGFCFLDLATSYTPEPDLAAFLESGPPPIYIGFGSIVVDDPNKLTRMIFDAVASTGVRALVSKGWGGLGADSVGIPEGVFMLGNCPHDWLFQKVSCVVHHGGAGTTAAGIKTGTPTVVVPFFGDQPFWGAMINKAGAGPAPIPYKKLTAENLAESITEALKPETQARAKELGEKIRQEKGADLAGKSFHDFLDFDNLRCSVAPSRVAVWRVRRTKARLSALAAAVLVKQGLLKYSDLKLYRGQEYDTEDQPWDPITAVTCALVTDISTFAMAIGDFPREMFKTVKKNRNRPGSPGDEDLPKASTSGGTSDLPSEAASMSSGTHPSLLVSPPATSDNMSTTTAVEGQSSSSPGPSRTPSGHKQNSSQGNLNMELAVNAGKGVSQIVETGMKTPMNFCLGLAKGFRNAPRLYNDDTVRKPEKVTDFVSGIRVAGKEFGFGLFDGISGLVTQPLKGAEKEGTAGLIKGFGKGIGGLIFKPAAGAWSIPAYAMKGVHAEVRSWFNKSVQNYIIASRMKQGNEDLQIATTEEQNDIVLRFNCKDDDELKGFYKLRESEAAKSPSAEQADPVELGTSPPKTGFFNTRHLSLEERRKLHEQKEAWKKKQQADAAGGAPTLPPRTNSTPGNASWEGEDMERAIQESVAKTSRGNKEEDATIEAQIRASVMEMRRIADQQRGELRDWKQPVQPPPPEKSSAGQPGHDITDEEYEALVEQAVRQSLANQSAGSQSSSGQEQRVATGEHSELQRLIAESIRASAAENAVSGSGGGADDDDVELKKAIEESEKAHKEHLARNSTAKSEEDIIMEFVRQQSLAEEEFRKKKKGKGKVAGNEDDDDEDLKRAMEESLRMHGKGGEGAGPSS